MKKKLYMKPMTEQTEMEKAPFVMTSGNGHVGEADPGVVIEDAKGFFSWSFQDREGIGSDKLDKSWDD